MRIFAKSINISDYIGTNADEIIDSHAKKTVVSLGAGTARGLPVWLRLILAVGLAFCGTLPVQAARRTTPTAPSNLSASAGSASQINLRWQDNSGNESGFIIQRGPASAGPWTQIATVSASVTSYVSTGLSASTIYYYRVCAYNSSGSSAYAGPAYATTLGTTCTYSISPASASLAYAAGSGSVSVTAGSGCSWTASSGASWISITAGSSGSGNGTVSYSVAANTSTSSRTGSMSIAGQTCTVLQAGASSGTSNNNFANATAISGPSVNVTGSNVGASKEAGEPNIVSANAGGASVWWSWTAPTSGSVTISTAGSSFDTMLGVFTGNSVSALTEVAGNDDSPLGGTLTSLVTFNAVAGMTYVIDVDGYNGGTGSIKLSLSLTSSGGCTYAITPSSASFASSVGNNTVAVSSSSSCGWTATSGASWITITAGSSGSGNGAVSYSLAANTSTSSRSGTMTIAGQTFSVNQAGAPACTYSLSSAGANLAAAAVSSTLTLTASSSTCGWSATSTDTSWLTCSPVSGTGSATVTCSAAANSSACSRTATLTIGGQAFTVTQNGSGCGYTLSSTSVSVVSGGGGGSVGVTAGSCCVWVATSGASWITITAGAAGTGSGTVYYSVAANTATSSRSSSMTIAGKTFTVSQAAAAGDTTLPSVSLMAPTSGSTVSGTIAPAASASDNVGVARVEFYRDGTTLVGTATASPYSVSDDTTKVANGSHSYNAKAYDAAGNSATSASSSVTVNNGAAPAGASCIWERHFGGTMINVDGASPTAIKEDHAGNVVVVGQFTGSVDFGGGRLTSAGGADVFIVKYDSTGAYQWSRRVGAIGTDKVGGVAIDSANNLVVVGSFGGTVDFGGSSLTSAGSMDIFVAKYGPSGALLWAKRFGGTAGECCNAVALDGANNILITGYYGYYGTGVDFGGGALPLSGGTTAFQWDMYVAKLSADGGYVWAKGYGGLGNDAGNGIAVDGNGDVVVAGSFQQSASFGGSTLASAGGYDVFVAKYAGSTGSHQWSVSGGGSGDDLGVGVAVDASGNVAVTGQFMGTANIGGSALSSPYNPGLSAMFLAKYSAAGGAVWSQGYVPVASYGSASGGGVAVDGVGNIVLTGYVQGAVGFGSANLGGGSPTIALAKVSGSGGIVWAKAYGSYTGNGGTGVSIGAGNNILVTGYFDQTADFGCGSMTSICQADGFAAKLSP